MVTTYTVKWVRDENATEDIEDAGVAADTAETDPSACCNSVCHDLEKPPIERFRKNDRLGVTELSAQLWCELQLEYTLITGKKRQTAAMTAGIARHEKLESADHETVEVEICSREDNLGIRLLNTMLLLDQLLTKGKARELWIFGTVETVVLRGIVDELELVEDEASCCAIRTMLTDTKTRSTETEPSDAQKRTSIIQLQMYYYMIEQIRQGKAGFNRLFECYRCSPDETFQCEVLREYGNLDTLSKLWVAKFKELPPMAECVEIQYECREKIFSRARVPYNEYGTTYAAHDLLAWWLGHRATEKVMDAEKWKCKMCDFLDRCTATPLPPTVKQEVLEKRAVAAETAVAHTDATSDPADKGGDITSSVRPANNPTDRFGTQLSETNAPGQTPVHQTENRKAPGQTPVHQIENPIPKPAKPARGFLGGGSFRKRAWSDVGTPTSPVPASLSSPAPRSRAASADASAKPSAFACKVYAAAAAALRPPSLPQKTNPPPLPRRGKKPTRPQTEQISWSFGNSPRKSEALRSPWTQFARQ